MLTTICYDDHWGHSTLVGGFNLSSKVLWPPWWLQWVCLGHLSAHNNSPEVALATHRERHGERFTIFCADRDGATQLPNIKQIEFFLRG